MTAKVSVIVPVYNTAPYLTRCLDSLVNQKLKDIEIVCIDDGSTDDSPKILDAYKRKDGRFVVVHKENGGRGTAYNTGLNLAKGEYVAFLDSDDWAEEGMLFDLYHTAQKNKTDLVRAGAHYVAMSDFEQRLEVQIPQEKCNRVIDNMLFLPELVSRHVAHWSGIYKNSFLKENGIRCFDEKEMLEVPMGLFSRVRRILGHQYPTTQKCVPDIGFMYKVWLNAKTCYVVPNAYVHYRVNQPTSSMSSGAKLSFGIIAEHKKIRDYMKSLPNTNSDHWRIKTRIEFDHFMFELNNRCNTRRGDFISAIAKIFRENLRLHLANPKSFSEEEWNRYQLIAYLPFIYWLNDTTKFWKTVFTENRGFTKWYLCGVYKKTWTPEWIKKYFLGFCYYHEQNYNGEFHRLNEKINVLQNQLNYLTDLLKNRGGKRK